MIGSTNLGGGGGVGSDELTATAPYILEGYTYVGSDTNDEIGTSTMQHLTNRATVTHTSSNGTKIIPCTNAYLTTNSDGVTRAQIQYSGTQGYITANTLFAVPQETMASAGGVTAAKLLKGQTAFGITGTATSDANASATYMSSGYTGYVNGSKITGSLTERGQYQYGSYGTGSNYIAFNAMPEGIYRKNGASWAPEARLATSTLRSGIGLSAEKIKKGVTILGITGTFTGQITSPYYLYNGRDNAPYISYTGGSVTASENHNNVDGNYTSTYFKLCEYRGKQVYKYQWALTRISSKAFSFMAYNTLHLYGSVTAHTNLGTVIFGISSNSWLSSPSFNASVGMETGSFQEWTINVSNFGADYWLYIYQATIETSKAASGSDVSVNKIWATS